MPNTTPYKLFSRYKNIPQSAVKETVNYNYCTYEYARTKPLICLSYEFLFHSIYLLLSSSVESVRYVASIRKNADYFHTHSSWPPIHLRHNSAKCTNNMQRRLLYCLCSPCPSPTIQPTTSFFIIYRLLPTSPVLVCAMRCTQINTTLNK